MKKVMIFGTFDGVHAGHRHVFREARKYGDHLIVVVARDVTVQKVRGRAPKYSEGVRWAYLHGEEEINAVILGGTGRKHDVIEQCKPDIICLGYDQEQFVRGLEKVFSGDIIRIKAYHPDRYKSSKLSKRRGYVQEAKKRFRAYARAERDRMLAGDRKKLSKALGKKILANKDIKKAQSVFLYHSVGSEVETGSLFQAFIGSGKSVFVPVLKRVGQFEVCKVDENTKWQKNRLGIPEPVQKEKYKGNIDVCIVPSIAVTQKGDRMGMGGGYYDRFLAKGQCVKSIGIAYNKQVVSCVPIERWDRRVDQVIAA